MSLLAPRNIMLVLDWEEAIPVFLQSTINIILLLLELKELSDKVC